MSWVVKYHKGWRVEEFKNQTGKLDHYSWQISGIKNKVWWADWTIKILARVIRSKNINFWRKDKRRIPEMQKIIVDNWIV